MITQSPSGTVSVAGFQMVDSTPTAAQVAREASRVESSSQSNWTEAVAKHASLEWLVDFRRETLRGAVTYEVKVLGDFVSKFVVDTHGGLAISRALVDNVEVEVSYGPVHEVFGIAASVPLRPKGVGALHKVRFEYETGGECSAAQWLGPEQTAGKTRPYLFTQCQAIHARSLMPCQDAPGAKVTWDAVVDAPAWATALMSGLAAPRGLPLTTPPPERDGCVRTFWKQPVPTSTYLVAIVVADLEAREISPRCRVWSEPCVVDAAADEFAETEDFLVAAEEITGQKYVWGRYDLVCLAPSFPYGGMENPCLTFVTPTLLAGDRSLAGVVAHEIAHSWTGNLITNATWNHFWLNEGWTRWLERRIKARLYGKGDAALRKKLTDFDLAASQQGLTGTVDHFESIGQRALTALVPPVEGIDPDDAFSLVPYEKGSSLLHLLEDLAGEAKFEKFVKDYVQAYKFKTLTSAEFKAFALEHLGAETLATVKWDAWFHDPGDVPQRQSLDASLAARAKDLAAAWIAGAPPPTDDFPNWTNDEKVAFLDTLGANGDDGDASSPLDVATLKALDDRYGLTASANAEIRSRWCKLLLAAGAATAGPLTVDFLTAQGRMKFVRPLYRALHKSPMDGAADLAVRTFVDHHNFYHPICRKMVASDLGVDLDALKRAAPTHRDDAPKLLLIAAAAAALLFIAFKAKQRA